MVQHSSGRAMPYDPPRRHDRVETPLEVRWSGLSGRQVARLSDIGLGGCYIESLGQVSDGEEIRIEIQLPTGRWLSLRGMIVYHLQNLGFGLRFIDLSETQVEVIRNLIDYLRGGRA